MTTWDTAVDLVIAGSGGGGMVAALRSFLFSWTSVTPVLGLLVLAVAWGRDLGPVAVAVVAVALGATVLAAVHHAEVVAHRVGEPFGSLVLAVAVTVIEVALIVTMMVSGGPEAGSLARDTVQRLDDIDLLIAETTERWRPERMAILDRLILRMAICEMLRDATTPPVVVINEALELARTFTTEESVKFINGMLDAIRKKIDTRTQRMTKDTEA